MADLCTLFCRNLDYRQVCNDARRLNLEFDLSGDEDCWTSMTIANPDGSTLKLSVVNDTGPGGRLSHVILGMLNFVRRAQNVDPTVIAAIASTTFVIGVVAEPSLSGQPGFLKLICAIAQSLAGVTFVNGTSVLDAGGRTILQV